MLMQKHSPNNKAVDGEDINVNSVDSLHLNGHFFPGRNASTAGSECNDDKSNDGCSSDDESHEHDNTEQENQTSFIDSSNRDQYKTSLKKKKKKTVKVKFAGAQEDKTGIKLKIRRTNNFNQDENHVIVDNVEEQRKRHLKNKRTKSVSQDGSVKPKLEEGSDDNLPLKRTKTESEDELRVSVGTNTMSKGTDIDEGCLGPCQAGTRLSLESVVLMETKSGILIVSVQWRGKTLMGALMESERFQIGSLEKDSIYRREKLMGINRRNTRRKSKNLFGKKKRKLTTQPDSGDHGGTENEGGNSDVDNPYLCDKESCHMRFSDFQTLRIHIYQKHRSKGDSATTKSSPRNICCDSISRQSLAHVHSNSDCKPSIPDLVTVKPEATTHLSSEERNTFSPAYSDISDANEAPVLENEAELKPSTASISQPPINLSLCHNPALLAASNRMLFSPTAPALQPEVNICSSHQLTNRRLPHDSKLSSQLESYRFTADPLLINGFINSLPSHHKPPNGALSLSSASNIAPLNSQSTDSGLNPIQDLSVGNSHLNVSTLHKYSHKLTDSNNQHKTAPTLLNCHKTPTSSVSRQPQSHMHATAHHHIHSSNNNNPLLSNGLKGNSKHSVSSDIAVPPGLPPPNGAVPLSHNLPYMSFSPSVSNQNNKFNYPINHVPLYQPKY